MKSVSKVLCYILTLVVSQLIKKYNYNERPNSEPVWYSDVQVWFGFRKCTGPICPKTKMASLDRLKQSRLLRFILCLEF